MAMVSIYSNKVLTKTTSNLMYVFLKKKKKKVKGEEQEMGKEQKVGRDLVWERLKMVLAATQLLPSELIKECCKSENDWFCKRRQKKSSL